MRTDQSSGRQRCQGFKEVGVALYVPLCVSVHVWGGWGKEPKGSGWANHTALPQVSPHLALHHPWKKGDIVVSGIGH